MCRLRGHVQKRSSTLVTPSAPTMDAMPNGVMPGVLANLMLQSLIREAAQHHLSGKPLVRLGGVPFEDKLIGFTLFC